MSRIESTGTELLVDAWNTDSVTQGYEYKEENSRDTANKWKES